jgi:hypothetical protein
MVDAKPRQKRCLGRLLKQAKVTTDYEAGNEEEEEEDAIEEQYAREG